MKNIKYLRFLFMTFCSLIIFSQCGIAQKSKKSDAKKIAVKNMVDSQHFVFEAQTVTPLRGNFRNLTSLYDVRVTKDSLHKLSALFWTSLFSTTKPNQIIT